MTTRIGSVQSVNFTAFDPGEMVQEQSGRMVFNAPTLVRLLARVAAVDAPAPTRSLSDSLNLWLGWTDAIALSTALKSGTPGESAVNPAAVSISVSEDNASIDAALPTPVVGDAEQRELARVRVSLTNAITGRANTTPRQATSQGRASHAAVTPRPREIDVDFAIHRQRYLTMQQTMEISVSNLRMRLRAALRAGTPDMKKLAVMDAIMEQVLDGRQRTLLAGVPVMLGAYFERLRTAEAARLAIATSDTEVPPASPPAPGTWVEVFRKDVQSVLLAELDIRLHPAEGLLAALRSC